MDCIQSVGDIDSALHSRRFAQKGYARDEKCRIRKYPMTLNGSTSPEAFVRSDFASETEAKEIVPVANAKECFLQNGIGPGEAPKDVNLTERATSKTEIQKYLGERRLERKREYRRKYMKAYRGKKAEESITEDRHGGLTVEEWQQVWQAEEELREVSQSKLHA